MKTSKWIVLAALAAALAPSVWAATFVKDVMLIGGTKSQTDDLKATLTGQGWTLIDNDLNKGCGSSSDYIYLLYKAGNTPGGNSCYGYVTGFYLKSGTDVPDSLTSGGKTYYLTPYRGGSHFTDRKGDLNSHAEGDTIHLYYTKAAFSPERAVSSIWFNDTQSGAVGKDGGSTGYDLNDNAHGDFIYMHYSTGAASTTIDLSALTKNYEAANEITLTGTLTANYTVSVADGATVTLNNVTIGSRSGLTAPGIACNGNATLTLVGANSVTGSSSVGVSVPSGKTLTINGSGSLAATGTGNNAGIGSAGSAACGSITISGGTVTATKGSTGSTEVNSIGPSQSGVSCGTVTIGGVETGPIAQNPITYSSTDPNTYTASFNANGGTGSTAAITSRPDTPHQIPANGFSRAGYTFDRWNTDANGSGATYVVGQWVILQNTTIYAQWSRLTYTIGYTLNYGVLPSGKTNPTSYNVDTDTFTLNNPTRDHYTFAGWTGTGLPSSAQTTVTISKGSTGNRAYTATWTPVTYSIDYDLNGGTLPSGMSNRDTYTVESATFTLVNPTPRTGYAFTGWTGTELSSPTTTVTITRGSTGDRSYTAHWAPITYTVHFDANGADGNMSDQTFTYDEAQSLSANLLNRTGYVFAGWSDSADGAALYADGANVSNLTATAGTVVTLYAVWSQTPWMTLQKRLDQGGTVVLSGDVAKTDVDERLVVTNAVTLDLNGHTLTGNGGSEVISVEGGNLTLTNSVEGAGAITGGARGVVVGEGAVFTMNGGTISGNAMPGYYGGGVYVSPNGTFTMTGGAISCNTAYSGGGVFVGYGIFTMSGGTISGNSAKYGGGGVSLISYSGSSSTFTMSGGTISGNASGDNTGGGVYADCAMHVSGTPVVSGNTNSVGAANNVYLATKKPIVIDGLRAGASIGVTAKYPPTGGGLVTIAEYGYGNARHFFSSDDPGYFLTDRYGDVCLRAPIPSSWEALQRQLDAGGAVTLADDVAAVDGDDPLLISGSVTLDLNGHSLAFNGGRFVVEVGSGGHLTLTNSVEGAGAVTGGSLGVRVRRGGTFTMTGGAISGNVANDDYGGGVYVDEYGAFTMTGGEISGNTSDWEGGGVYVEEYGTFTMSGGAIHGNSAFNGGGVFVEGAMAISGSPVISGNTNFLGEANNVYLEPGKALAVAGLSAGASIGVAILSRDVFDTVVVTEGAAAGDSRYFSSDVPGIVVDERNCEVCFTAPRTPWQMLQAQLDQGGNVTLTDDISARAYDGALIVTNTVLLDLAGHTLMGYRGDLVIDVREGGALTLTNGVGRTGSITGGVRGVLVEDGGVFTMAGGTIFGIQAEYGGGVLVEGGGTFEMTGGEISDNTSYWEGGGGVYVEEYGTFTMSGGAISGNVANDGYGGGVYVDESGTFTMSGGEISGNTSDSNGGGVFMLWNSTFTMSGGTISANEAGYGGGVMINFGMFTMTGGTITGNVARGYGNGNGMVRGAAAPCGGGGVYVLGDNTFTVSGNPVVSGNTNSVGAADNVCLSSWNVIAVDGLSAGASIGVTSEIEPEDGNPVVLTDGAAAGDIAYFFSDDPGYHVGFANGEVCLSTPMTWERLQTALDSGGAVTLPNDVAAGEGDTSLVVSGAVLLDLAGHTIAGNGSNTVISIASGGDLTLTNSVPASGAITGGRAEQGGGVRVGGNAAFTMDGGVISGNAADPGGGVFVDSHGTFTMNGGAITNNFSAGRRGGGGGVCVYSSATFTLNGGKISGNVANAMGGGVCLFSCTFTVSGNPVVSGNTDAEGATSNIDLPYSQKIGVGTLSAGASIGVTTGWPDAMHHVVITSGASAGDSRYFFCDVSYFHVEDNGGEVCIVTSVTPWTTLQKQLLEGGTVTLTNDCAASAYDYPLYVTNAVTLDLAGHTIAGNGDSEVISIEGGDLTLTNSVEGAGAVTGGSMGVYVNKDGVFTMNGGTISGNSSPYSNNGGGVFVAGGAFTMNDGLISGNGADSGGGVRVGTGYSYDTWEKIPGTFTMNGGVISGNSADDDGGGVYVYEDAAFALNGGMISGNRADLGGGVYVDSNAIFSMTGGTISNNTVKSESSSWYEARGGGVYDYGAFTMTGGEISGNDADFGGGVFVYDGGAFTMTGGTVSGNNADEDGGGVYVEDDAIFMMNGGAISGNTAHFGGGVYVSYDSLFTMTGGTISGNAAEYGGGVCFSEGEMLVSGSPVISGNTGSAMSSHNVYLEGTLTVSNLTVGASIGVKTSSRPDWDSPVTFTEGAEAGDKDCFFSDDPACSVDVGDGGELCLKRVREDAWTLLQARLDAGGAVTLADSVSAPSLDTPSLVVTNAVTLDLAGHTISGSFHDSIFRIGAGGVLTITNSVEGVGAVTGGYNWYGGGVYVGSNGVFRLQGGAISGNRAYSGGGVSVDEFGVFTMTGGAISGNQAEGGGGVSVYGDSDDCLCPGVFTMSGGTISGNVAYDGFGGGMYMEGDAVVTLTGGEISGNAAVSWGEYGGVAVFSSAFTVAGNPVVFGNTNDVGEASNVYLSGGKTIAVDGLSAGASIGVTTETVPEDGHPVAIAAGATSGDAAHFFSDDPSNRVELVNGELCLVVGAGLPAYLDGANELVIANYRAWAAKYGPDVAGAHEAAFLLDIDPATPIPAGAALLKIVDFSITPTRLHIEVASDVTEFVEKETEIPMLGNGFLVLRSGPSLSSDSDWTPPLPVPFEIRGGRAVIDMESESENGQMSPAAFFKTAITTFVNFAVIELEE